MKHVTRRAALNYDGRTRKDSPLDLMVPEEDREAAVDMFYVVAFFLPLATKKTQTYYYQLYTCV